MSIDERIDALRESIRELSGVAREQTAQRRIDAENIRALARIAGAKGGAE